MLPILCFLGVAMIDYGRCSYATVAITNCARNGALYASLSSTIPPPSFTTAQQTALQGELSYLTPAPTIAQPTSGTDASGNVYVRVSVSYTFQTLINYLGIANTLNLNRTFTMATTPP